MNGETGLQLNMSLKDGRDMIAEAAQTAEEP